MTIPNTFTNGTLADADEVNANFAYTNDFYDLVNTSGLVTGYPTGIIAHSATIWSVVNNSGDLFNSTDSGASWTSKNATPNAVSLIRLCKADATYGVAVEYGNLANPEVTVTTDSGATWTSKTSIVFPNGVYDVSMPTTSLIVVGGNDGAGIDFVQRSVDNGTNWVDATTSPATVVYALDMYDGTTGYCLDASSNIWKTTDGGDTWTDTTDNSSISTENTRIMCLSATVAIVSTNGTLEYYDNTAHTVTAKFSTNTAMNPIGLISTDSRIYAGLVKQANDQSTWIMLMSEDSGLTWALKGMPMYQLNGTLGGYKHSLSVYDTGKLIIPNGQSLLKIDHSKL